MVTALLGKTVGNRYRFDDLLGEGSFAYVYRVYDFQRRTELSAKVLRAEVAADPEFLERFQREAAVLAHLQHPHIVRYYDIVQLGGYVFILMDYIPGRTLQLILAEHQRPLSPHEFMPYMTPLAAALHYAHSEGVIHRDIKPANIVIDENGKLHITDFGIARVLNEASTMGITIGTPLYMSPEQIMGQRITVETDIYALGILLYEMVTGRVPFRGDSPQAAGETMPAARVAFEHIHLPPPLPSSLNPQLDPAIEDVILQCLEKDRARRFHSVSALYDALTEAVGAPPISLDTPTMADTPATPTSPPDVKLPEWSQFMDPVPDAVEPILTTPEPETHPHLEKSLHPPAEQPTAPETIPSMHRVEEPATLPRQSTAPPFPPPPVYAPAQPYYPPAPSRSGSRFLVLASLVGALIVAITLCVAGIYWIRSSGGEDEPESDHPDSSDTTTGGFGPITDGIGDQSSAPPNVQGERIAFDSQRAGDLDIYIMNADGSGLVQLTTGTGDERGPSWSPDGTQLAFYGAQPGESNYDIYVMNVDGSDTHNLTDSPEVDDRYPSWSPDGRQLAFHSNVDGDYEIYIINADGSGARQITDNDDADLGPDWSPDGTRIAYHTDQWDSDYEIAVITLATSEVRRLTDNENANSFPTWSPDGTRLAFHAITPNTQIVNIYTIAADGSDLRRITDARETNSFPDWSADGNYLIHQNGSEDSSAIILIPAVGGEPQVLTGRQGNFLPEWEPAR